MAANEEILPTSRVLLTLVGHHVHFGSPSRTQSIRVVRKSRLAAPTGIVWLPPMTEDACVRRARKGSERMPILHLASE